jgi:hypothetical protein
LQLIHIDGLGPALESLISRGRLLHLRITFTHKLGRPSDIRFGLFTIQNGRIVLEYLDLLLAALGTHLLVRLATSVLDHLHVQLVVRPNDGERLRLVSVEIGLIGGHDLNVLQELLIRVILFGLINQGPSRLRVGLLFTYQGIRVIKTLTISVVRC